jgi:hypothetical protein
MSDPTWLTLAQVARRINISTKLLNRAIHSTDPRVHLPAVLNGNKWLVRTRDADAARRRAASQQFTPTKGTAMLFRFTILAAIFSLLVHPVPAKKDMHIESVQVSR